MLTEVPPLARESLRPLFADCPGLKGMVHAILAGAHGRAFADDMAQPKLAVLSLDFDIVGGRPDPENVARLVGHLPREGFLLVPDEWHEPVRRALGDRLQENRRYEYNGSAFERDVLRGFREALPDGFKLGRVTGAGVADYWTLMDVLQLSYASRADFLARGVGFGIEHEGRYVAGCASFTLADGMLEVEVQTREPYRRRGFAQATSAALIEWCLDNGIQPCWDAANIMSARLAKTLGYTDEAPYMAFRVLPGS